MNEMLNQYNNLVEVARSIGITKFRPIKRFRPANSGPERIAQIEAALIGPPSEAVVAEDFGVEASVVDAIMEEVPQQEDTTMAKAKKTKAPKAPKAAKKAAAKPAKTGTGKRGRPPTNGETIAAKTKVTYNKELVPVAKKKGIAWAKEHTSNFGSHVAADAAIKKLQDAIKAA